MTPLLALGIGDWGPTEWAEALIATSLVIGAIWQAATANTKLSTVIQTLKTLDRDVREIRKHNNSLSFRVVRLEAMRGIHHSAEDDEENGEGDAGGA